MEVSYTSRFKKKFSRLSKKIQKQFQERLNKLLINPKDPVLKVHPLKGDLVGFRAFSVSGNYRVIYKIASKQEIKLVDIGTHSQVY